MVRLPHGNKIAAAASLVSSRLKLGVLIDLRGVCHCALIGVLERAEHTGCTAQQVTDRITVMSQDFLNSLVSVVAEKVSAANAIAEQVGAASVNVNKSIKEWRENSTDPEAVAYRERYEKMQEVILREREKIDALAKEKIGVSTLTDDELTAKREEHKTLHKAAKDALATAQATAEMLGLTLPAEMPELLTFKGGKSSGGGTGTGGRRLRFASVTINGEEVKSLSKAALKIKSETGVDTRATDLQSAVFEEAGTDDMSKITDVNFLYSATDKDGKTHSFDITCVREDNDGEVVTGGTATE